MKIEDIAPGFWYILDDEKEDGFGIAQVVLEEHYSGEGVQLYAFTTGHELPWRVDEYIDQFIQSVPDPVDR